MAALSEQEEFEFRLRAEQEAKASPAAPAADPVAAGQRLLAQGVPLAPDAPGAPAAPEPVKPPLGARIMDMGRGAVETALRGTIPPIAANLGAVAGLAKLDPTGVGDAAGDAANRAIDSVIGRSQSAQDISSALQSSGIPLEAIAGHAGEGAMMARGLGNARLPNMPKVPGLEGARGVVDRVTGGPAAGRLAEELRQRALGVAGQGAGAARGEAQTAQGQATAAQRALGQLQGQPEAASARALQRAPNPAEALAEKAAVREKVAARARQAESDARAAGLSAQQAKAHVASVEQHVADVDTVGSRLDEELMARDKGTGDDTGPLVRGAVDSVYAKLDAERARDSGYTKALEADGSKPVATSSVESVIAKHEQGIANPTLQSTIDTIKKTVADASTVEKPSAILDAEGKPMTPGGGVSSMTVKQADSFRKYLDGILQTKQVRVAGGNSLAVDSDTLKVIGDIRKAHVASMDESSALLKAARAKYRELSRADLSEFERKGSIAPLRAQDAVSGDYKVAESRITGVLIDKANKGSSGLSVLVKHEPGVKDAARMHFSNELFSGAEVPTAKALEKFLAKNERSLKQTGLYDEFGSIAKAKRAHQDTVDSLREDLGGAKRQAQETGQKATQAARDAGKATQLSKLSQSSLNKALGGLELPEDIAERSARRADQARTGLEGKARTAQSAVERQSARARSFETFQTQAQAMPAKELPGAIKSWATGLAKSGDISQEELASINTQADAVAKQYSSAESRKRLLKTVAAVIGIGAAGREAARLVP